ncbi:MAG TPA: radical SAM protein [bacterium]|nr:radical SAM protein [bacterium]
MYTYGPVPSRRLGKSIGVSPIPAKTCSYSCVYCQLGRTDKFTVDRKSFFDPQKIFSELQERVLNSNADYITFVGDGEPTLNSDLGWLINQSKENFDLPVAVITNGSLLYREDVQKDLQNANLVMPSIDAGQETVFKRINRPHKELDFNTIVQGTIDFSKNFKGQVWTETMLVKGYNDNKEELKRIKAIIEKIAPEKSFIMSPTRPPAEDVDPPEPGIYLYAQKLISGSRAIAYHETGNFNISKYKDTQEAISEITARHPLRREQAQWIAEQFDEKAELKNLIDQGKFFIKQYSGSKYILPQKLFKG